MRSFLAVFLSAALFVSTLDAQTITPQKNSNRTTDADALLAATLAKALISDLQAATDSPQILVMEQCESDQCVHGGGGAIWIFEGDKGEAVWHYGAAANLTLHRDRDGLTVRRVDPKGTYSSRWANGGEFIASYNGLVRSGKVNGSVWWGEPHNKGTWYAKITDGVCDGDGTCPLDPGQLVELGENALGNELYTAAMLCFDAAAARGDYDGEAFGALMLRDGAPGLRANPAEAFRRLKDSADHGSVSGARGLSQSYQTGIGTQKSLALAALWRNKAVAREHEIEAEQARRRAQAQTNQLTGLLIGGAAAALFFGAIFSGSSNSGDDEDFTYRAHQRARDNAMAACGSGDAAACQQSNMPPPN